MFLIDKPKVVKGKIIKKIVHKNLIMSFKLYLSDNQNVLKAEDKIVKHKF